MMQLGTYLRPPRPRSGRSAFTLIELMIVVSVIIVLAAMLMPSFNMAKMRAYNARSRDRVAELNAGAFAYSRDNNGLFPGQAKISDLTTTGTLTGSQILAICLFGDDTATPLAKPTGRYANYQVGDLVKVAGHDNSIWDRFPGTFAQPVAYFPAVPGAALASRFVKNHNAAYYSNKKDGYSAGDANYWSRGNGTALVQGSFDAFITDTQTNNASRSSFILLAPGIDRVFGTSDDLMNF